MRKRGSPDVLGRPRVIAANAVAGAIIGTVLYLGELGGEERHATQRAAS